MDDVLANHPNSKRRDGAVFSVKRWLLGCIDDWILHRADKYYASLTARHEYGREKKRQTRLTSTRLQGRHRMSFQIFFLTFFGYCKITIKEKIFGVVLCTCNMALLSNSVFQTLTESATQEGYTLRI